jgi:hypothetical protein
MVEVVVRDLAIYRCVPVLMNLSIQNDNVLIEYCHQLNCSVCSFPPLCSSYSTIHGESACVCHP